MIESSIYLWTPKNLKNLNSIQRAAQKLWFVLFRNIVYGINTPYLCKLCNYIDKVDWAHFLRASYTTFQNFIATSLALQKWWAIQLLTIFDKFLLQHLVMHKYYGIHETYFPKLVWRYPNYYQLPKKPHL